MRQLPFISVILPHLNQLDALPGCLASLEAQTYPRHRFEVIVVDNGSSRSLDELIARFDRVRLEREARPGPGAARNRGVELARGDILAFIDADCTADRDWLAAVQRGFEANPAGTILGGDVRIARQDGRRVSALEAYEIVFAYRQREYIERHGFSGTGNLAVMRREFEFIGPFDGIEVAEDRAWGRRALARGYRIVFVADMVVFHPARCTFDELAAKWNRHIGHDHEEWFRQGRSTAAWLLRALAVAVSALTDMRKPLLTRQLRGAGARVKAMAVLARIRLYRSRQMIRIMFDSGAATQRLIWNRPPHTP